MDLTQMLNAANSMIQGHSHDALMLMAGAIVSHPAQCADLVFKLLMASPFKPLVLQAAPTVLEWADTFEAEIAKNLKREADAAAAAPPAPPSPEALKK